MKDCRLFDADGREVFLTLTCPQCERTRPLRAFGLRRMGDGTIRNAPWCTSCRGRPRAPGKLTYRQARELAAVIDRALASRRVRT